MAGSAAPRVTDMRMQKEEDDENMTANATPSFVPGTQAKFGNAKPLTDMQKKASANKLADMLRTRQ